MKYRMYNSREFKNPLNKICTGTIVSLLEFETHSFYKSGIFNGSTFEHEIYPAHKC